MEPFIHSQLLFRRSRHCRQESAASTRMSGYFLRTGSQHVSTGEALGELFARKNASAIGVSRIQRNFEPTLRPNQLALSPWPPHPRNRGEGKKKLVGPNDYHRIHTTHVGQAQVH